MLVHVVSVEDIFSFYIQVVPHMLPSIIAIWVDYQIDSKLPCFNFTHHNVRLFQHVGFFSYMLEATFSFVIYLKMLDICSMDGYLSNIYIYICSLDGLFDVKFRYFFN